MYKQARAFNQSLAGKTPGYCLQNVRRGYSIGSKYPTALQAWNHTQQHKDRSLPSGVATPLFYTFGSSGHINVHLANGQVWSDGNLYSSLDDYLSKHPTVHYLGWGESVNDVTVLQYAPDPKPSSLPAVGSKIRLLAPQTRSTWKVGTAVKAGTIHVTDDSFVYIIHGYDSKYPGRAIINSASGGGDGVGLALHFNDGSLVEGWVKV